MSRLKLPRDLLTGPQVCRLLRIQPSTLTKYRKRNRIPFYQVGGPNGLFRYSEAEVLASCRHMEKKEGGAA